MERLTSTKSKSFEWTRTGKASTLVADGQVYATITWTKSWGSLARGESADGEWTLKRIGFLRPRVTVRTPGSSSDLAVVTMDWNGGGSVAFSDASAFAFRRAGFWHPQLVLTDSVGTRVFAMTPTASLGKQEAILTLENEAARSSWRTSLLAILGWYLSILITDYDGSASMVAVMAATGY